MKLAGIILATAGLVLLAPVLSTGAAAQEGGAQDDVAARVALEAFGRCVAAEKPGESARVLGLDFTKASYRTGLRLLADSVRRTCANDAVGQGNAMRSSNLLMAGSVAEGLLESGSQPVNVRLVRASASSVATFAPTDAVAQCLARSLPDQVGAMFAAAPGSAAETTAAAPLLAAVPGCSKAANVQAAIQVTVPALRAMVATAAFRLVASFEKTDA